MRYENVKCLGKYLLIIFIMFFTFNNNVKAICDNQHIKELKALAEQIDVSYEYIEEDESDSVDVEEGDLYMPNMYSLSLNLISNELYLNYNNHDYYYDTYEDGNVFLTGEAGSIKLNIYSTKCADIKIKAINLNLPKFNVYSKREECLNLKEYNLDVCNPWYQGSISETSFLKIIEEYLNMDDEDKSNFFIDNYIYFLGAFILIVIVVVIVIFNNKRSVLK